MSLYRLPKVWSTAIAFLHSSIASSRRPLKAVGAAAERVCLGGGVERERLRVKLDRAIEVTTQVMFLPFHPQRQCLVLRTPSSMALSVTWHCQINALAWYQWDV